MGIGLIDIDAKDCMMLKAHQSLSNKELSLRTVSYTHLDSYIKDALAITIDTGALMLAQPRLGKIEFLLSLIHIFPTKNDRYVESSCQLC